MQTAFTVLTDSTLFAHIVGFQCGLPYAVRMFEPEVCVAEATRHPFHPCDADGAFLLHHALLTDNVRIMELLLRMREQPYYAAMRRFALDGAVEKVCKRGSVRHLEALHGQPHVFTSWPSNLLQVTLDELECPVPERSPEELVMFHNEQKNKALWLMKCHPEACTYRVKPHRGVFISANELRDFFLELLAADRVDLSTEPVYGDRCFDVSLLELMLRKCPRVITPQLVEVCASHGNLEGVKFLHDHEHELPEELFTSWVMDAAAKHGHLDVVRFLHERRTEGCTQRAIDDAARAHHLDVVKFLLEHRTEGFSPGTIESMVDYEDYDKRNLGIVQCLVKHHPEAIQDPTSWELNDAVKHVRSVWAKHAVASNDPVQAFRAAVIHVTDVESFKKLHEQNHPTACTAQPHWRDHSVLRLAIDAENDAIAAFLVNNCEHVRAAIRFDELFACGSGLRPPNLELVDLLLANRPSSDRLNTYLLQRAAGVSNMPFAKALLERGVPCTEDVLREALCGENFEVAEYLMETYPEQITTEAMQFVARRGEYAYLFKLHASHPHLWESSIVSEIIYHDNAAELTTWEVVRSLYECNSSTPLEDYICRGVWQDYHHDDVLLFMWLVWQDPQLPKGLAAVERGYRLRLYMRLLGLVPSLFADVPVSLPWCCQLRILRQRVECGELRLADVECARSETTPPS